MCLSACRSFCHLYPPVRVRLCLPRLARPLQILMHMILGSPWWLIEMRNPSSLTVTQIVTPTPSTAAPCWGGLPYTSQKENRNHGPQNARTEMAISLVTRTMIEIMTGIMIGPKRAITDMVQSSLMDALHDGKCSSNGMHERLCGHESPSDSRKTKQSHGVSASPSRSHKKLHTPERRPLPPPPMFHSTPLAAPHRVSSDPASAHLSFNQSRSSLPPLDLGEGDAHPISSASAPIQASIPSVTDPILPSVSVSALNLTVDHIKHLFSLACAGWHLKEWVVREFIRLSSQEVLFRT